MPITLSCGPVLGRGVENISGSEDAGLASFTGCAGVSALIAGSGCFGAFSCAAWASAFSLVLGLLTFTVSTVCSGFLGFGFSSTLGVSTGLGCSFFGDSFFSAGFTTGSATGATGSFFGSSLAFSGCFCSALAGFTGLPFESRSMWPTMWGVTVVGRSWISSFDCASGAFALTFWRSVESFTDLLFMSLSLLYSACNRL